MDTKHTLSVARAWVVCTSCIIVFFVHNGWACCGHLCPCQASSYTVQQNLRARVSSVHGALKAMAEPSNSHKTPRSGLSATPWAHADSEPNPTIIVLHIYLAILHLGPLARPDTASDMVHTWASKQASVCVCVCV
jgi:hypothetical protein